MPQRVELEFLTPREAAQEMGLHHNSVLLAIREGRLPALHCGDRRLILRQDVEVYRARARRERTEG